MARSCQRRLRALGLLCRGDSDIDRPTDGKNLRRARCNSPLTIRPLLHAGHSQGRSRAPSRVVSLSLMLAGRSARFACRLRTGHRPSALSGFSRDSEQHEGRRQSRPPLSDQSGLILGALAARKSGSCQKLSSRATEPEIYASPMRLPPSRKRAAASGANRNASRKSSLEYRGSVLRIVAAKARPSSNRPARARQ